jgi:predicted HAD superfamily Cof-like phosphohydrolase
MSLSNYGDVHLFHRKMDLLHPKIPQLLSTGLMVQRENFIQEELDELMVAFYGDNLAAVADALVDLVYVVMGTAVMMGLPWQAIWDAVQYANIRKERDYSRDTEHHKGVVKPPGWTPPDIDGVLGRYIALANKMKNHGVDPDLLATQYNGVEDLHQRMVDKGDR